MVVFRLRAALSRILRSPSRLPTSSHAPPPLVFPHRLLASSAAAASSPGSFAVEEYLVSRLGLTQAQALKAAAKLSHLRSSAKPEAVLAYLESTLGIPAADVGRAVVIRPRFLCTNVEETLARALPTCATSLGSFDKILQVLRWCSDFFTVDLDKTTRPNVAFLRQCGLNISEIAGGSLYYARLFTMNPESLKEAVQRVQELGIARGAGIFTLALAVVALTSKDVQGNLDFLMKDVGLEVSYIVRRPALPNYSVERQLLPRHCLIKVLKEKGLLKGKLDYYLTAAMAEKIFVGKFVRPFKNHVPGLTDDYASKCLGEATVE
ncbi:hypothetical protein SETIT_2G391800v2 [Setaria italica]|uniref:Uncharacterized protein n=1 Tax=Setaria italica TaxID=4555 RepID=A0A368Q8G4_SETIT|nr:hypothetical protein SETIT_2G391800v2 [Setaria italica]